MAITQLNSKTGRPTLRIGTPHLPIQFMNVLIRGLGMDWSLAISDRTFATAERMESRHSQICSIRMWGRRHLQYSDRGETCASAATSRYFRWPSVQSIAAVPGARQPMGQSHRGLFRTTLPSWGNASRHRTAPNQNGKPASSCEKGVMWCDQDERNMRIADRMLRLTCGLTPWLIMNPSMRLWTDGGRDMHEDRDAMSFSRGLWTAECWKWIIFSATLRPPQEGPIGTALREDELRPRTGIMELTLHSNPFPLTRRLTDMVRHDLEAWSITFYHMSRFGPVCALVSPRPCAGRMTVQKYRRNTGGSTGGKQVGSRHAWDAHSRKALSLDSCGAREGIL
jgi:hypothetical protein